MARVAPAQSAQHSAFLLSREKSARDPRELPSVLFTGARSWRRTDSTQLLRVGDGYRDIGLSRSGGDGAILV